MWVNEDLMNSIKIFLPPESQIVLVELPIKRPAIELVDLDGDGILEVVCAYYWLGEIYIIVMKCYNNSWYVLDIVKGKGYGITYFKACPVTNESKSNLIVGWKVGAIWSDLSLYELTGRELKDLIHGNKYFSIIEVLNIEDETCQLAIWIHDTGKAYKVEVYRWKDGQLGLAPDLYPYYFKKVANYYKKILKEKDSTTYWYYLADAQIKIGKIEEACKSIDKALSFQYPYPSVEKLMELKEQTCEYRKEYSKHGIDFSSVKYVPSETRKDVQLEQAIIEAFNLEDDEQNIRYYYNKVDLNDDGDKEIFAYLVGPFICGTGGCSAAIFKKLNGRYSLVSKFSLVNNPIIISDKKTEGYKDIIMYVSGGGIESFFAEMKYNGNSYPSNPSIQPKVKPGTKIEGIAIIANDISSNTGIQLMNSKLK